jgi:hypothetical protein
VRAVRAQAVLILQEELVDAVSGAPSTDRLAVEACKRSGENSVKWRVTASVQRSDSS